MGKRVAFEDGNLHSKEFYNSNGASHKDAIHDCLEVGEKMVYFERKSALDKYKIGDTPLLYMYNHNNIRKGRFPNTSFKNIKVKITQSMWIAGTDERLDNLIDLNTLVGSERKHCVEIQRIA